MSQSEISSKFAKIAASRARKAQAVIAAAEPPAFQGYTQAPIGEPTRLIAYALKHRAGIESSYSVTQEKLLKDKNRRYDVYVLDEAKSKKFDQKETVKLFQALAHDIKAKYYS
jgi:hypothetical protein